MLVILKVKNDKLDKKITCDTIHGNDGELQRKTLSTYDNHPPCIILSSFGDTLLQKQDKK
jgi:hypothetical protein